MPVRTAAFFQVLEGLAAFFRLLFFQQMLARDHDVAALLVQLDDRDFNRLALHAIQVANGPQVNLRAGQEGARAVDSTVRPPLMRSTTTPLIGFFSL